MIEVRSLESARQETSGPRMYLLAVWYWIGTHVALTIAIVGALFIVAGATVLPGEAPIYAGMFGVWGVTLIIMGLFFDLVFRGIALYQNRTATSV
ncbi:MULTISPECIES: hypothetical protein [Halorussus]|uniref:hypothetical protein n=1 Tax=Halorussus TaxID=1070314 RepID=UPI00209EE626|nr:hypothetical protein [Halorussus vallis]USZ78380.1 hypothetical protein NGM07_22935 [Halorussus vallis]